MALRRREHRLRLWALAGCILGLSACVDYTIETTLHPDGGGYRTERMEVGENDGLKMSAREFGEVMLVTSDRGWSHSTEVNSKGDTTNILERRTQIRDLGSWGDLDDAVQISGARGADANGRIGPVTLGDIRFRNRVEVEKGTLTDGRSTFVYRETFYWENAVEALVEIFMGPFSEAVAAKYPLLSEEQRGQIVGIARAHLWAACQEGIFDDDGNEDELLNRARDRTATQAVQVVRMRYPQESRFFLRDLLQKLYDGDGEAGEKATSLLEQRLPGLNLAFNTSLKIRLNMPGQVMNSNRHTVDGSTLVWELEALSAAASPVEIFAESVVGG
jgi:hypothetical protein